MHRKYRSRPNFFSGTTGLKVEINVGFLPVCAKRSLEEKKSHAGVNFT